VALGLNNLRGVLCQRARAFQKYKSFYSASTPLHSLSILQLNELKANIFDLEENILTKNN